MQTTLPQLTQLAQLAVVLLFGGGVIALCALTVGVATLISRLRR